MASVRIDINLAELGDEIRPNPATVPEREHGYQFVIVRVGADQAVSLIGTPEELLGFAERIRDLAHTVELERAAQRLETGVAS